MKKFLYAQIVLIVFFVLFASAMTAYTLLDAFILDRSLGTTDTGNPSFTLSPTRPSNPSGTTDSTSDTKKTPAIDAPVTGTSPQTTNRNESPITSTSIPESTPEETTEKISAVEYPIIEDRYYKDENIEIKIDEYTFNREAGENGNIAPVKTRYFVIDLKLSDIEYLRTHFRQKNGKVTKATTSELAKDVGAIFAINGDYFSFRKSGFVIRNYVHYRNTRRSLKNPVLNGDDALFVLPDGTLMMFDENNKLFDNGLPSDVFHCFSFGPRLIENGRITVDKNSEAGQSAESNPRTAIGMVAPLHYKIVVSEGRLVDHDGITLLELAEIMKTLGCDTAYNLDGGSSTTLYFNGKVINTPGRSDGSEREISDIIYINGKSHSEDN